jgi:hypothetical protein
MKKYIALLGSASVISAVCGAEQPAIPLENQMANMQLADYNSETEYATHQKTSERFFRRQTKNATARTLIRKFREQYAAHSDYTSIPLDGLSSRTRILLIREITASLRGVSTTVPFAFHGKEFKIVITPSLRQPGSGIVSRIGEYADVVNVLDIYKTSYQATIAKKLIKARQKPDGHNQGALDYHPAISKPILSLDREEGVEQDYKEKLDLEMLNILLDFEVARRLQGTKEQEEQSYYAKSIESALTNVNNYIDYIGDQQKEGEPGADIGVAEKEKERLEALKEQLDVFIKEIAGAHDSLLNVASKKEKKAIDVRCTFAKPETKAKYLEENMNAMKNDARLLDSVPVATAIVGLLKLSRQNEENPLQKFFHAPDEDIRKYSCGKYSVFEGAPTSGSRAQATKRIIRKMRGGENAQLSTREQVHQEYLKNFGGASESDGSDYNA